MINTIEGKTINEIVYKCLDKIHKEGIRTASRNGDATALYNVFATLTDPRNRHLSLKGRKNNIFATIAETIWVFAGETNVKYLEFFLKRARNFADDGEHWYGGYGGRIFTDEYDQVEDVIQQFLTEGKVSRRAVIYIGDPNYDTLTMVNKKLGKEKSVDRPCNMAIDFFITPEDNKLHMNVKQRSGDVIWGFGSINMFEWAFLQEYICDRLRYEGFTDLTLGTYNHHVTNLHLYEFTGKQGYEVLKYGLDQKLGVVNQAFPTTFTIDHNFYSLKFFCYLLWHNYIVRCIDTVQNEHDFLELLDDLDTFFSVYKENNLLYEYARILMYYIAQKNIGDTFMERYVLEDDNKFYEFRQSFENSKFNKISI